LKTVKFCQKPPSIIIIIIAVVVYLPPVGLLKEASH
jgi:hypothetical protein